jgi:ribonuclease-3
MNLESIIGYTFANRRLLQEALTHPSCAESVRDVPFNYQRLEFLGDSVLGLVVAELLYGLFPEESEGNLAKRHAALVRSESLAAVARMLGLGKFIHVGGEQDSARESNSSLEDVCEALIGAMYLDGGFDVARTFVLTHWEPLARTTRQPPKDAKTTLQEWAQARGLPLPRYRLAETTGPAHAPEFTIEASVEGHDAVAVAKAASKRQAEQVAAKELLEKLEGGHG